MNPAVVVACITCLHVQPARHLQRGARDVLGPAAGEEQRCLRHVVRVAHVPQRDLVQQFRHHLLRHGRGHGRIDETESVKKISY